MPADKKKLFFYIGTLGGGGAEHVLLALLNNLDRKKYDLAIILNRMDGRLVNQIPSDVRLFDRSETYKSGINLVNRFWGLAKLIKRENPDLVISFLTGANRSLMRCRYFVNRNVKFILREGNNPDHIKRSAVSVKEKLLSRFEVRWLYPKADQIITASTGIKNDFVENWGMKSGLFTAIHNMIDISQIQKQVNDAPELQAGNGEKTLIAVGRLVKQKGYDDLLKVFAKVRERIPSRLIILGAGPEKLNIETWIQDLSLDGDVIMPGYVNNPWEYMKMADLYLSTSLYEGFHLTIVEAMACGTTPVITDCDYGPREIIDDGINGYLCPVGDIENMAKKVTELLKDEPARKRASKKAEEKAMQFDISVTIKNYEELFDEMMA